MSRYAIWVGVLTLIGGIAFPNGAGAQNFCAKTAQLLHSACRSELQDDFLVASAICLNVEDAAERTECYREARASRAESAELCTDQLSWRRRACRVLGQDRYDPDFDPASFETDFANLQHPNAYFPLTIGNFWVYENDEELNTVEVLDQTKLIEGVTCVVLNDLVFHNGDLVEDTDDWFAQATDGNVWYCGEEVKDYESFDGDDPRREELVSVDGSFKAGRDRDKPGIIFRASPVVDEAYIEEFSLGNAEDMTEVLSTDYSFGIDPNLDALVPQALADILCAGDCVVTKNFSLLEPGVAALKYYAAGIGFFLEIDPDSGKVTQLTDCNFDARCANLPQR